MRIKLGQELWWAGYSGEWSTSYSTGRVVVARRHRDGTFTVRHIGSERIERVLANSLHATMQDASHTAACVRYPGGVC
jgi:hypothetical protein